MYLSTFCRLCAAHGNGIRLTEVNGDLGKKENLEHLINKYIDRHLLLPKSDRLCLCDTCKTRINSWNAFIVSCQKAQERLKDVFNQRSNDDQSQEENQCKVGASTDTVRSHVSESPQKLKRSSNYCIARWCNKGNYRGVSLFRLPKDRNRAVVWLSRAERSDLKNKQNLHSYYICANHFTPSMFTNKACNQLIKNAEPTLFPRLSLLKTFGKDDSTSQFQPTQLRGVQLKSILPKSTPVSLSSTGNHPHLIADGGKKQKLDFEITQHTQPRNTMTLGSNVAFVETSSRVTAFTNVLYVVNSASVSCLAQDGNSPLVSTNEDSLSVSVVSNKQRKLTDSDNILSDSFVQSGNESHGKATSPICKESSEVCLTSDNSKETQVELSCILEKEQKSFLDDLGPCLTSDAFNTTSLINVNEGFQESFEFRETKPQSCDKPHSKLEIMNDTSHTQCNENHQISTVGSQDFLLPHVCEIIDKQPITFSEQTYPLKSETIPETVCATSLKVSSTGLFDLQADDMQGTDHSSYISGVDEFLDLDRYFERR